MQRADVIVIGGGIVGLATAWQIQRRQPGTVVAILEKEAALGQHQSGRNSGVLHSGVYYKPGSLKAQNCATGRLAMIEFCRKHDIPHEICGKVIVATRDSELPHLEALHQRGHANNVDCEIIDKARLSEIEPHVVGLQALWIPQAGIVDYPAVVTKLSELIQNSGGRIHLKTKVSGLQKGANEVVVLTNSGEFQAQRIINCAGLHSDRIVQLTGMKPPARIIPFRGEYYRLKASSPRLCRNLVYPVPDPALPFLGVHFTRMIDGTIEAGPNAVLALAREGYKKTDIHLPDMFRTLTYPGFLRLAFQHWQTGATEVWRSINKGAFVRALQQLIPSIKAEHLEPAAAGIRAQAVTSNGDLVDDFLIEESERVLHLCNAPSPGATASLNIGATLAETAGF